MEKNQPQQHSKTPVKSRNSCFGIVFQIAVLQNTIKMKTILKLTGYDFSPKKSTGNEQSISLSYIANRDGSPKWVWNAENTEPLFLKFYNVGNKNSWLYAKLIQIIFALQLQRFFFKQKKWFYNVTENPLFDCKSNWALFTGTVGSDHKAVLYANKTFYKIAGNENAKESIANEYRILKNLQLSTRGFTTPLVRLVNENIIQLSDVSDNGKRVTEITDTHLKVLREMALIKKQTLAVENWTWYRQLESDFLDIQDTRIPQNLVRKIEFLLNSITKQQRVTLGFSQGDFTPWNQYVQDDTIALYDWELARTDRPYAFDYFHFVIQQGVIMDRKKWATIYKDLKEQCVDSKGNCLFDHDLDTFKHQLKWYLLTNCMHSLKVFAEQSAWNTSIDCLLNIWNEALDLFFEEEKAPRELVIMEVFDSIQNSEYGALKFPDFAPEKLSETSDIDLVIEKKEAKKILQLLTNHHLVSDVSVEKKTFMYALQATLIDGSILTIDLFWQLKIRNLEIMNTHEVYKNNPLSPFGIKQARAIDAARFTTLSYLLNRAKVPSRYLHYLPLLEKSQNVLDLQIIYCIKTNYRDQSKLLQFIKNNPKNQSLLYCINMAFYILDSIKSFINTSSYAPKPIELNLENTSIVKHYYTVGKNWNYLSKNYLLNNL